VNITNLGRYGAFNTAQLLDGTVEIISVADHDAHHKLQIRLHKNGKSAMGLNLHYIAEFTDKDGNLHYIIFNLKWGT